MNLKELIEKRNAKVVEMGNLVTKAETEERAMSEEETNKFNVLDKEVKQLDGTIASAKRAQELTLTEEEKEEKKKEESIEEAEKRAFEDYIRSGRIEERADAVNMTKGDNGAVIPKTIANKIIDKIINICPIFELSTRYNVKGTLDIPYYDETSGTIKMDYADEFTEATSNSGKMKSISLTGYLARGLTLISKSLINNSQFDIVTFVINKMALAGKLFIERELLHGTVNKIDGLNGVKLNVVSSASTAITADELIDLQEEIPDAYIPNSIWIMAKTTRKAIRKLKDNDGNYILNKDATARWGYTLLGNDVYVSDAMDGMEAGKVVIYFGDMTGLAVKISEELNIQVLNEKYAEQHAVGVLQFVELDSKVEDGQKIAKLTMKSA